jgi:hypothetical protein
VVGGGTLTHMMILASSSKIALLMTYVRTTHMIVTCVYVAMWEFGDKECSHITDNSKMYAKAREIDDNVKGDHFTLYTDHILYTCSTIVVAKRYLSRTC